MRSTPAYDGERLKASEGLWRWAACRCLPHRGVLKIHVTPSGGYVSCGVVQAMASISTVQYHVGKWRVASGGVWRTRKIMANQAKYPGDYSLTLVGRQFDI